MLTREQIEEIHGDARVFIVLIFLEEGRKSFVFDLISNGDIGIKYANDINSIRQQLLNFFLDFSDACVSKNLGRIVHRYPIILRRCVK